MADSGNNSLDFYCYVLSKCLLPNRGTGRPAAGQPALQSSQRSRRSQGARGSAGRLIRRGEPPSQTPGSPPRNKSHQAVLLLLLLLASWLQTLLMRPDPSPAQRSRAPATQQACAAG